MGGLQKVTVLAFLGLEITLKLIFVRAFGNALAPGGDHGRITRMYFAPTLPVTAIWLAVVGALTARVERLGRSRGLSGSRAVVAQRRLPNQLALAWCTNWFATLVLIAAQVGAIASVGSVCCLMLSVTIGSTVLGHTLSVWLVESRVRDVSREHLAATPLRSLRVRLGAYGLGLCGAPTMYVASLAFSVQHYPMAFDAFVREVVFQAGAIAGFAVTSSVLIALSILGPVRRMAMIMRTVAAGAEYAQVERLPLLQNDELGALSDSTNQMLDRLECSDRERLALHATLEHKVKERTAQLRDASAQIARDFEARARIELELRQAQRLEAIGRLAAGIAHEINTPIQFVSDSLQFVRTGIGELTAVLDRCAAGPGQATMAADALEIDADLPYLREHMPLAVERALEGLARVTAIVRAMKDFAHPDRREMVAVDLNEAIRSTLMIARHEYKYVAELDTDLGDLPPVTCYVGDFNQVIINLVVNAAHAIGDVVGSSGDKGRITIATRQDGPDVVVRIGDTGDGIPEAIRDSIFDPFFTTKGVGKGTGQGLAISRAVVVEKHRGSLTFESLPGKGTTFLIRIPIAGSIAPAIAVA